MAALANKVREVLDAWKTASARGGSAGVNVSSIVSSQYGHHALTWF